MSLPDTRVPPVIRGDVDGDREAVEASGVDAADVHFLQGSEEGLRILDPEGEEGTLRQRVTRKVESVMLEDDVLAILAERIRSGRTLLGVHHVAPDDADRLTDVCADNDVEDVHYLGRWTMH